MDFRPSGGSDKWDDYLIVTELPHPEVHWCVPVEDYNNWVRDLLESTNAEDPAQWNEMIARLKQFEIEH